MKRREVRFLGDVEPAQGHWTFAFSAWGVLEISEIDWDEVASQEKLGGIPLGEKVALISPMFPTKGEAEAWWKNAQRNDATHGSAGARHDGRKTGEEPMTAFEAHVERGLPADYNERTRQERMALEDNFGVSHCHLCGGMMYPGEAGAHMQCQQELSMA